MSIRPLEVRNPGSVNSSQPRSLVTGGAGFLGSHLCDRLLAMGHMVICVDNLFSGQKSNIAHLLSNPNFEFRRHDVIEPVNVQVDFIYHLACPASPVYYQKDAVFTLKTGFLGTLNVLELAKAVGARLLITSTSEVYGDPIEHPQKETYWGNVNCIGIRSCYDEGKRIAETLCMDFHRQYGTDVRISRLFNTYGPRMLENDGRVVSNFVVQALRNKPLTIYGDGSQTRSFCFVDDTIEGIIRLMHSDDIGPMNIGNPGEYTIKELAETVQSMVNPAIGVTYLPVPSDDPKMRQPDISRARDILKWKPKISLREGLKKTIEDFRLRIAEEAEKIASVKVKQDALKNDLVN